MYGITVNKRRTLLQPCLNQLVKTPRLVRLLRLFFFLPPVWSCCVLCQDWAWGSSDVICGCAHRRPHSRWCLAAPPAGACVSASWFAGENLAPGVWTDRVKGTRSENYKGRATCKEILRVNMHVDASVCPHRTCNLYPLYQRLRHSPPEGRTIHTPPAIQYAINYKNVYA